jgi:hypothetical protein
MRIGVADDEVEDRCIEQFQYFCSGLNCGAAQQFEARLERRSALSGVFTLRRDAKRLTEILLMDAQGSKATQNSQLSRIDRIKKNVG